MPTIDWQRTQDILSGTLWVDPYTGKEKRHVLLTTEWQKVASHWPLTNAEIATLRQHIEAR